MLVKLSTDTTMRATAAALQAAVQANHFGVMQVTTLRRDGYDLAKKRVKECLNNS